MYSLIEYSSNYSEKTGSLWFYFKDEATNFNANIGNDKFESFEYKAKLLGNTVAQSAPNQGNEILKNVTIALPLKYLSNFWRSFEMPLISCKIELKFKWTKYCVFSATGNDNPNNIIFNMKDKIIYVLVVTLTAKDNKKLLNPLFERSVYWNEYKTKK